MADEQPLVSVALCTYNGERYLKEQLESVLGQSYTKLEIIIVDDASVDATGEIITSFKNKDPRIKFFKNEINLGFNRNFERALSLTHGELIAFSDQDDIWLPNKIETMVKGMGNNWLLFHDSELIDAQGSSLGISIQTHHRFVKGKCDVNLLYNNCISAHALMFRRELLAYWPPVPQVLYFDWWMAYTAGCIGKLDYLEQKLVKHRIHAESSTQKDRSDNKELRIKQLTAFYNHPLTENNTKSLLASILLGYHKTLKQKTSNKLFFILLTNYNKLFYIRKRSFYSRLKFILKESNIL